MAKFTKKAKAVRARVKKAVGKAGRRAKKAAKAVRARVKKAVGKAGRRKETSEAKKIQAGVGRGPS